MRKAAPGRTRVPIGVSENPCEVEAAGHRRVAVAGRRRAEDGFRAHPEPHDATRREQIERGGELGDVDSDASERVARGRHVEPEPRLTNARACDHPLRSRTLRFTGVIVPIAHVTEAMEITASAPAISVMFATIRGWPAARLPIDATRDQLTQVGGELIVMDGSGRPPPTEAEVGEHVTWVSRPGESVFQLRNAGYDVCRGEIIAVTEDHVAPAPDWCDRILAAHRANPNAIAIGGAVENGTTEHLVDWATFIVTQTPFVGPLRNGPAERIAGAATVTYKRDAVDRRPSHGDFGAIELFDTAEMRRPGELLLNDDSIRVSHHQSTGLGLTTALQFHNGRAIAGLRRREMARGDWARLLGSPILPLYRTARSVRLAWSRWIPKSRIVVTLPLIVFFHYSQMAGEVVGYVRGPGSSAGRLL